MKYIYFFILLPFSFLFQACNMVNPKESIPTYIQIDSVQIASAAPLIHGSVSHKITDVWVYYNLQLLGAFQLPAKVPVLSTQQGQLQVVAGIWDNGLSGTRAKYPFLSVDTFTFNPAPASTIQHIPMFTYRTADSQAIDYFIEDFEQGNSFGPLNGDTSFIKTNLAGEVFEGNWSNKLELFDTVKLGQSITIQEFALPSNKISYIELNYKNDIPFVLKTEVHLSGLVFQIDLIGLNTSTSWNKIYVNFGTVAATYPGATFKFMLQATLPDNTTQGKVLVDNFKIIHFK